MESQSNEQLICRNCGSQLQPEHRFCPNCGTAVDRDEGEEPASTQEYGYEGLFESPSSGEKSVTQDPADEPDPSILETREHATQDFQSPPYPEQGPPVPPPEPPIQDTGHPTWGTAETTVPPERGNRTLWIILAIIAFIVLVCCCVLPLALSIIANVDTTFQNELRSSSSVLPAVW